MCVCVQEMAFHEFERKSRIGRVREVLQEAVYLALGPTARITSDVLLWT